MEIVFDCVPESIPNLERLCLKRQLTVMIGPGPGGNHEVKVFVHSQRDARAIVRFAGLDE